MHGREIKLKNKLRTLLVFDLYYWSVSKMRYRIDI